MTWTPPISKRLERIQQATSALAELRSATYQQPDFRSLGDQVSLLSRERSAAALLAAHAAAIALEADRRLGEMLAAVPWRTGPRRKNGDMKLIDFNLDRNESHRCRRLAGVPQDAFDEYVATYLEYRKQPTAAGLLRVAKREPNPNPDPEPERTPQ